jgi:hypothetical protein
MSVSSEVSKDVQTVQSPTAFFSIPFDVTVDENGNAENIRVWLTNDSGQLLPELVQGGNDGFAVAGTTVVKLNADASGQEDVPAGYKVTILRDPPFTQTYDFVDNQVFSAEAFERSLDLIVYQQQRLQEQIDRSLTLPVDEEGTNFDLALPGEAVRANRFLRFNGDGDLDVYQGAPPNDWDPAFPYGLNDVTAYNGQLYRSKKSPNTANTPTEETTDANWAWLSVSPFVSWGGADGTELTLRGADGELESPVDLGEKATAQQWNLDTPGHYQLQTTYKQGGNLSTPSVKLVNEVASVAPVTDNLDGTIDITFNFDLGSTTATTPDLRNQIDTIDVTDNGNGTFDLEFNFLWGSDTITTPDLTGPAGAAIATYVSTSDPTTQGSDGDLYFVVDS